MRRTTYTCEKILFLLAAMGMIISFIAATAPCARAVEEEKYEDKAAVSAGIQQKEVDADENRGAKFEEYREIPDGFVINYLSWSISRKDAGLGDTYFQFIGKDVLQKDEKIGARFGIFGKLDINLDWTKTPHNFSSGAKFLLDSVSPGTYRIADETQMLFQDPNGDGTLGDTTDIPAFVADFLDSRDTLKIGIRRNEGGFHLRWTPVAHWSFNLNATQEKRSGIRALGTGSYLRTTGIADSDGVGTDSLYPVRGIEVPEPIDYTTTALNFGFKYTHQRFFGGFTYQASSFENNVPTLVYDNPFWFNDCNAAGGTPGCPPGTSQRYLVKEGRMDLSPDNDAQNLILSGGVFLPLSTQITVLLSRGETTQDDSFIPWTTNTALIGVADINKDGTVDATDDPTTTALLPRRSLDGKVETTTVNLVITSRPWKPLRLTARYRTYDYDSTHDQVSLPGYVQYVDSAWVTAFNSQPITHHPIDFSKKVSALEASIHPWKYFGAMLFFQRNSWDYDIYKDLDEDVDHVRDVGTRAVEGIDDDTMGITLFTNPVSWFDARLTYSDSSREFDGTYTTFSPKEHQGVRQYDLFERCRTNLDAQVNFNPLEKLTFGIGYRTIEDDYADTPVTWDGNEGEPFGFREREENGVTFNLNYAVDRKVSLFAYAEGSKAETLVHGQTKFGTFANLNNTWFTELTDKSKAYGIGGNFVIAEDRYYLDASLNFADGKVSYDSWNPISDFDTGDRNSISAEAFDYPDQVSKTWAGELKLWRKFSPRYALGISYLYEKFDLDDFQWDVLTPYAYSFITNDDGVRYLLLDSRYSGYTAHVAQLFMKIKF